MPNQIAVLKGDYIGPEIMNAGLKVLEAIANKYGFDYQIVEAPFGGEANEDCGYPLPPQTIGKVKASDAVLVSAIGGPKWDHAEKRPEQGLLQIRSKLNLYSNIRPTSISEAMTQYSPIKNANDVDFVIVRELTSGIYFGTPRHKDDFQALDTMYYTREEIKRVAKIAFDMAEKRRHHVTLVDKSNVLDTSKFWREVVVEVAKDYPDVKLDYCYVDAASMKIISNPGQFDVILTENLFGDILSDEAAQITGSLGTIPSMSIGDGGPALYEPIHGSAPDIAGLGVANPFSMINSVAMMLANSFNRNDLAQKIYQAINQVITDGAVTPDLGGHYKTEQVTSAVIDNI